MFLLGRMASEKTGWISSDAADFEIGRIPDPERRRRVQSLAAYAKTHVTVGERELTRAAQIQSLGFKPYDALHLACAESGGAAVFLTTDDRLLRLAQRHRKHLQVQVANPVDWVQDAKP